MAVVPVNTDSLTFGPRGGAGVQVVVPQKFTAGALLSVYAFSILTLVRKSCHLQSPIPSHEECPCCVSKDP